MMIRLTPDQRRALIVSTGVEIANRNGLISATHASIAGGCRMKMSTPTVRKYFTTRTELLIAIINDPRATKDTRMQGESLGLK